MHFSERLYPQARLGMLLSNIETKGNVIDLSIGEPNVPLAQYVLSQIPDGFEALAQYPKAALQYELQETIATWLSRRYRIDLQCFSAKDQIAILAGSREGIFMLPIALFNHQLQHGHPITVALPDPGYPIYLASAENVGAKVQTISQAQLSKLTANELDVYACWAEIDLMFVCSPSNPTGEVLSLLQWTRLIELAKQHQFILVADECYSEIYSEPFAPTGLLEACTKIGNSKFENCLAIHSLSKRSGLPGLRSGFIAGDTHLIKSLQAYRNYHGVSLSSIQLKASQAAWSDEQHVLSNRQVYGRKFDEFSKQFSDLACYQMPEGGFYIWLDVGCPAEKFCQRLYQEFAIKVLPGHYLAVSDLTVEALQQYVRIAVVCEQEDIPFIGQAIKQTMQFCCHSNPVGGHVA